MEHNEVLNVGIGFQKELEGGKGLNVGVGAKPSCDLGGFIVFWKWKWDLNIFIVNKKHTLCFTCLPAAQIETIFPIRRPK